MIIINCSRLHLLRSVAVFLKVSAYATLGMAILFGAPAAHTVTDLRPALEMLKVLEEKYGWRITYEDPPFEYPGELKDITHPSYKASHPDPSDVTLVPTAKPFSFVWDDMGQRTDRRTTVDSVIAAHNNSGNPGIFRTYHQGDVSHVIAAEAKKQDGTIFGRGSLLDVRISFPVQDRSIWDAINLILQAVQSQTEVHILVGMVPSYAMSHRTWVGANNVSARDALLSVFNSYDAEAFSRGFARSRMTWALLYQADQKTYYFNFHPIKPVASPSSGFLVAPR